MSASSPADVLTRRVLPRTVVVLSRVDWPARFAASTRRRLGRRGRVELFFAFDDPCSAVAVIDLAERLAGRDVQLLLEPVVERGIPDDPAVEMKRRYAVADAGRIAHRSGLALSREEPVAAEDTAFLTAWAAGAPQGPSRVRFCVAALRRLWLESDGPVDPAAYAPLYEAAFGSAPPAAPDEEPVRRCERHMARRGPYDTPAAWVHGQWFFAHDRLPQIAERLDDLGWTAAR